MLEVPLAENWLSIGSAYLDKSPFVSSKGASDYDFIE